MRGDSIRFPEPDPKSGVCVVDGYGVSVTVNRGRLVVKDGVGRLRRERVYSRAQRELRRLVIIGHAGSVSLEAVRWLSDIGASLVHLDTDGRVLSTSTIQSSDDARLRRIQALAMTRPVGLEVVRWILVEKIAGQLALLPTLEASSEIAALVEEALRFARAADSVEGVLRAEAEAALHYWEAWAGAEVRFPRSQAERVPAHWSAFGQRGSPLARGPRLAVTPINAILNYLYAILEAETRIACVAMGFEPGLGFFHTDQRSRDSLALDLMEIARPSVDAFVLDLLRSRMFSTQDFVETRGGVCRLMPSLTHRLAETAPLWARASAPIAEDLAGILIAAEGSPAWEARTPLTHAKRLGARGRFAAPARFAASARELPMTCVGCGSELEDRSRVYCDECIPAHRVESIRPLIAASLETLDSRRREGRDPAHGGPAAKKRGATNSEKNRAAHAWNREHDRPDPDEFARTILPGLEGVPVKRMRAATGLSLAYCSQIRAGKRVPHPQQWDGLRALSEAAAEAQIREASL